MAYAAEGSRSARFESDAADYRNRNVNVIGVMQLV